MRTHEERIGVVLPGQGPHIVTVQVGALETDEVVLRRISTALGTIFNVGGVKYEVVSSSPFRLKRIANKPREEEAVDEEPPAIEVVPEEAAQISTEAVPLEAQAPEPVEKPSTVRPPESSSRLNTINGPRVGERWRPKDPRRKADFIVVAIEDDHAVTNDGRRIQLARFRRYERVPSSESKAS